MSKVGAHVSAAISLNLSLEKAQAMGAECTQIFISPPRQWSQIKHNEEGTLRYKDIAKKSGIGPNFIHGTYLVNLGTQNPKHLQKSIDWLTYALIEADKLGIEGVIFHPGSSSKLSFETILPQVINALTIILQSVPRPRWNVRTPVLILETSAGAGAVIGDTFVELGQILKQVNNPRLKICLDTCHVFAAGYDIKTPEGIEGTLKEFDKEIGLQNLVAIHANDSKFEIGSKKDRHANIGEGFIGKDGFKNLLNHPKLKNIPFILEVPGFENNGPDKKNVIALKSLINPDVSS